MLEAKKLCVLAWWWKGGALRGGARERRAACVRAIAGALMPATELRKHRVCASRAERWLLL
jgi:hypothetical protein